MAWLRNVVIDLLVTIVIAVFVLTEADWGYWIIVIYTPLILLLKIGAALSGISGAVKKGVKKKPGDLDKDVPVWFYHALYGANLIMLLYVNWWVISVAWAAIWILSAVQEARSPKKDSA
ncbi:MAG: hypothetical protein BMS9Abin05_1396 [Rhodothermia bacterium]|nr:MAG: hypothetical protein BMS9Abin05_1396 [Rhodothermia bacterium]